MCTASSDASCECLIPSWGEVEASFENIRALLCSQLSKQQEQINVRTAGMSNTIPEVTDIPQIVDPFPHLEPLDLSEWCILPTYRLQLTPFYWNEDGEQRSKTTKIRKVFHGESTANDAALDLARLYCGREQLVMLVDSSPGSPDELHKYAIGQWDRQVKSLHEREPCVWNLALEYDLDRVRDHETSIAGIA